MTNRNRVDTAIVSHYCQTTMKTITLRTLVREPLKVKRMTRSGQQVHVTDHGKPLWLIQTAVAPIDEARRRGEIEE